MMKKIIKVMNKKSTEEFVGKTGIFFFTLILGKKGYDMFKKKKEAN